MMPPTMPASPGGRTDKEMPTDGTPGCRQRPRKRGRAYELPTRQEFEKYRSEWLGRIPQNVKSRFREGGFSKWGKDWLLVCELGQFDFEPGPVRDMWLEMFHNVFLSSAAW